MTEYEIIPKDFEGRDIEFIKKDNKVWLSTRTIAEGLNINKKNINQIYNNNKDLLDAFSGTMKIMSPQGTKQNTRVFDKTGFIGICMRSNSPKAVPFQKWALNVVDNVLTTGQHIEKSFEYGSTDWIIQQFDIMKNMALKQKETEGRMEAIEYKVSSVESELKTEIKTFQKKVEGERLIIPQTKKKIADIVKKCVENSGLHWGKFWPKIWNHFSISSYKDTTEVIGQKILQWIETNPYFQKYLKSKFKKL